MKSGKVNRADRAGRAPYNFVPLPDRVKWIKEEEGPAQRIPGDRYHGAGHFSGEIEVELEALTPFYIRGMWPLADFIQNRREVKAQPEPFQAAGALRLPGSSLRGMVRSLVEIMGNCALAPINNRLMFFRAVGASSSPKHSSFEPNAKSYKDRISPGQGTFADPAYPVSKVGYLWKSEDKWFIRPAKAGPYGSQWYRIIAPATQAPPKLVDFLPEPPDVANYQHSTHVFYRFGIIQHCQDATAAAPLPGWERGYLIRSGRIPRKYLQWVIHEMDAAANPIEIPPDDVAAYVSDRDARPTLKYPGNGPPQPCFYIEWQDTAGTRHVTFGHTPHFRLPYRTTPDVANPARRRKGEKNWDLAEAIFGRTPDRDETGEKGEKGDRRQGARGRVFFEDAFLDRSPANSVGPETHLLLSSPKLTTYQHYIVQPKTDEPSDILHWDGDYTGGSQPMVRVRGFKRYWHRKGAKPPSVDRPTDSTTTVRLARESCVFKARIRFENLLAHELGALLMAVELPADCRHQLGMAKAHGLGTFKITLSRVRLCDKRRRYSALFKPGHTEWQTGFMPPLDADRRQIPRDFFASWVLNRKATEEEFWRQERMVELAALLEWDEAPSQDWLRATRYLEIEHQVNGDKRNEYKFPGKVRALPSASQVRRMGPEIPKD